MSYELDSEKREIPFIPGHPEKRVTTLPHVCHLLFENNYRVSF